MRNLLPQSSAGGDEEGDEDTYTTSSTRAVTVNWRNQVLTVHHALEERPMGNAAA